MIDVLFAKCHPERRLARKAEEPQSKDPYTATNVSSPVGVLRLVAVLLAQDDKR